MANVQYSGVRESKLGRVNDLGTTGKEVEENFRKGLSEETTGLCTRTSMPAE